MANANRHPFLKGLSKHRGASPTILIIFGASGDLTKRKLIPAIYNLGLDNLLPSEFHLIGVGRKKISDQEFREITINAIKGYSRRPLNQEVLQQWKGNIYYHSGSYDLETDFTELAKKIDQIAQSHNRPMQLQFYISTPPSVFQPIIENLGAVGLARRNLENELSSKVIIEKPFGVDLQTAQALNASLTAQFEERQIYRIDHYLGKETVQDLLVQRFSNAIFEPVWNRQYVDNVQITVSESLGVGTRAGYYDKSGAMRDMIQNHTMQLLTLTAMEPPVSLDPESIRDEKVKVLKAIQPLYLGKDRCDVVRARYTEGLTEGERVIGYAEESGVPPDSYTETYAAMKLSINNWRWKGVPFYLRSGKRMARRVSEIAVQFKRPPGILFTEGDRFNIAGNTMVIRIQPDEGVTLVMNSKVPGLETRTQPVKMSFSYATTYGSDTPEAYERLILDSMVGDSTLFIRGDETEASWNLVSPILDYWQEQGKVGLYTYAAGSWGPLEAEQLLWDHKNKWRISG